MMNVLVLWFAVILAAGSECEPPSSRDRTPCSDRSGHCFDLTLDGQSVVLMTSKEAISALDGIASQSVCWQLTEPVVGSLQPVFAANAYTPKQLGELYEEVEIFVTPLEGQTIPTRKEIRTDPTVRIGGAPMQTIIDVIDMSTLPDGAYVATFRVRGPGGWDRKAVHFRVDRAHPE